MHTAAMTSQAALTVSPWNSATTAKATAPRMDSPAQPSFACKLIDASVHPCGRRLGQLARKRIDLGQNRWPDRFATLRTRRGAAIRIAIAETMLNPNASTNPLV